MDTYTISFEVAAHDIMDAYARARLINLRTVDIVAQKRARLTRVGMRWAVTIDAFAPTGRRAEVTIAFDGEQRSVPTVPARAARVIVDKLSLNGDPIPGETMGYAVSAGDLAQLVRSMAIFPLDMLDAMADDDERKRREGAGYPIAPGKP